MDEHLLGAIELALVFGGTIAWGVWELWSTRRAQRESARHEAQAQRSDSTDAPPPA